jgi:hypothetical protein
VCGGMENERNLLPLSNLNEPARMTDKIVNKASMSLFNGCASKCSLLTCRLVSSIEVNQTCFHFQHTHCSSVVIHEGIPKSLNLSAMRQCNVASHERVFQSFANAILMQLKFLVLVTVKIVAEKRIIRY